MTPAAAQRRLLCCAPTGQGGARPGSSTQGHTQSTGQGLQAMDISEGPEQQPESCCPPGSPAEHQHPAPPCRPVPACPWMHWEFLREEAQAAQTGINKMLQHCTEVRTNTNLCSKCKCFPGLCTLSVSFQEIFHGLHENGKAKCKERQGLSSSL